MNNKVLVRLYVPLLDKNYDLFVPVNEVVWKIVSLSFKGCLEINGISLNGNKQYTLINKVTSEVYSMNKVIYETNIRNGTELILLIK